MRYELFLYEGRCLQLATSASVVINTHWYVVVSGPWTCKFIIP
jgi:hypothetical protein